MNQRTGCQRQRCQRLADLAGQGFLFGIRPPARNLRRIDRADANQVTTGIDAADLKRGGRAARHIDPVPVVTAPLRLVGNSAADR